ncbi:hypothetical protein JW698_00010 [Candidatus Wolfebacteria bacterium]|nr:hypothetical protein [Candidatus Wolfebacteria bacterium]
MKKLFLIFLLLILALVSTGCALLPRQKATAVVYSQGGSVDPGGDAYKTVLFQNKSPFWWKVPIGQETLIIAPGSEAVTKIVSNFLNREFGNFTIMAYAYHKFNGKRLSEYIGQQEYWFCLDGYPRYYNGRTFGAVVVMSYCSVSPFPGPTKWRGRILGIIPWEAEIR